MPQKLSRVLLGISPRGPALSTNPPGPPGRRERDRVAASRPGESPPPRRLLPSPVRAACGPVTPGGLSAPTTRLICGQTDGVHDSLSPEQQSQDGSLTRALCSQPPGYSGQISALRCRALPMFVLGAICVGRPGGVFGCLVMTTFWSVTAADGVGSGATSWAISGLMCLQNHAKECVGFLCRYTGSLHSGYQCSDTLLVTAGPPIILDESVLIRRFV